MISLLLYRMVHLVIMKVSNYWYQTSYCCNIHLYLDVPSSEHYCHYCYQWVIIVIVKCIVNIIAVIAIVVIIIVIGTVTTIVIAFVVIILIIIIIIISWMSINFLIIMVITVSLLSSSLSPSRVPHRHHYHLDGFLFRHCSIRQHASA